MTETHLHRRQRVMGALVGAIVGDALAAPFAAEPPGAFTARFPRPVLTGHGEMLDGGRWTEHTQMMLQVAESLIDAEGLSEADLEARGVGGEPLVRTIPAAIAFAAEGADATIDAAQRLCRLTNHDDDAIEACVALHLAIEDALGGRDEVAGLDGVDSFSQALVRTIDAGGDTRIAACCAGALAGARWGIGAIPARWASPLHGPVSGDADSDYDIVSLRTLAVRLANLAPEDNVEEPAWPARGPHLVDPRGLWVADLNGAARSHEVVPGAHVVSLSRVGDRPQQPHWRRFYLVDSADPDDNIALDEVLDDVMTTVTACIEAGEPVVVHCFAGESRTGLVLRAWLMQRDGLTEAEATEAAMELWPHLKTWNSAFTEALRRREGSGTVR